MRKIAWIMWLSLSSCSIAAQTCNKSVPRITPDDRFAIQNAVVVDKMTGLMWQRCSEGQRWKDKACQGSAKTYTFDAAQKISSSIAGYSDWRVPTIAELGTIVELACYKPAINESVFPNTQNKWFWSSSPYVFYTDYAWDMNFEYGNDNSNDRTSEYRVRLVRAGQ